MFITKTIKLILSVIFIGVYLSACTSPATPAPALTPIIVQLRWTHQAQFAGFYAADQNGYYAKEGLAATFLEGGPQVNFMESVLNGTAQFGILNAEKLITGRADGEAVRAIATIYRHSPAVYMSLADSGITRPQDFIGKTIEIGSNGKPLLYAMMNRVGVQPEQYTLVESTNDLSRFYTRQVQVRSVYLTNEVLAAKDAGYKVNIIYPDDYSIHFYGDTLFTSDDFINKNPDLTLRFLRATLKGWTYAIENPDTVAAMVAKYNPKADLKHETAQMIASLPLVNTGEDHIGWMKADIWAGMEITLREQGVLTQPLDVTQVYTLQFLEEIYK